MSDAVNNKVRHDKDNHLGFTMYWKYKANSVILRSIESYPTACLLFSRTSHFPSDRGNAAFMVKNSLHFIFNISSEKLHDNQIVVSFDVEWLFTTVSVKETVQVLLIKLECDNETKPF